MRATTLAVVGCWGAFVGLALPVLVRAREVGHPWPAPALYLGAGVVCLVLASLIARRRPGQVAAVLIAAAAVAADTAMYSGPLMQGAWMLLYLPFALLLLTAPDGRLPSPGWRVVAWGLPAVVLVFQVVAVVGALRPDLGAAHPLAGDVVGWVLVVSLMAGLVASAVAPLRRYRRADEATRLGLRWYLLAACLVPGTLLLCWVSLLVLGTVDLVVFGLAAMYIGVPIAVTMALLHPTWADVDRAVVSAVSACLAAVVVLAGLTVLRLATGQTLDAWPVQALVAASAAVTIVGVVCFRLGTTRLGLLVYPERARAGRALANLAALVESGRAVPTDVEAVLRSCLADPDLVVAYRGLVDPTLRTATGAPLDEAMRGVRPGPRSIVSHHGEQVGVVACSAARTMPPAASVVTAAAPLVSAARVQTSLAAARAEVEASRERILRAGYEERRRLERDLHDGAQQRLVALGMQLRVLQRSSGVDRAAAAGLDAAVAQVGTAVGELRLLAQGVRPRALDDGLAAALHDLAATVPADVRLDLHIADLPALADDTATTAYFVVAESVTNALRHAGASSITVRVDDDAGQVRVLVADDGGGGAHARARGGIAGLADRVTALGGTLRLRSPERGGTTVEAVLPCGS
ncbi:sensor histidine kinase [Propionibacteriaceae bacterium G1746]|uniref:sensor histidine kinase n=1 Tax=Aestuariimicrobium sp. G57 TaxID=3418485 RepID=UPI003C25B9EB